MICEELAGSVRSEALSYERANRVKKERSSSPQVWAHLYWWLPAVGPSAQTEWVDSLFMVLQADIVTECWKQITWCIGGSEVWCILMQFLHVWAQQWGLFDY